MSAPVNHYALTRLLDQFIGAPPLRQASRAASVTSPFGLGS
jgi:phage portal protein BeeE